MIIRRKFLQFVITLTGITLLLGDFLAPLFASSSTQRVSKPAKSKQIPVTNLNGALKSRNPDAVATFVLTHSSSAKQASTAQKIQLLKRMNVGEGTEGYARQGLNHGEYEKAVLVLLRSTEKNPNQLVQIVQGLGGKKWLKKHSTKIRNSELRYIANQAIKK